MKQSKVILYLLLLFVVSVCSDVSDDQTNDNQSHEAKTDELVLAVGGEPEEGFDPSTGWGRYGSPLFQSTLLTRDKDLSIKNDLAENYHINDDGLTWMVEIREDALFADGERVTVEDVIFTFKQASESGSVVDLSNLESVEKVDKSTIEFNLKEPQSTFVSLLVSTGIIPKHAYGEDYHENPLGSGPYQIVQWDKGQQLIVEANPYYYGDRPHFERLTFLFLSEDTAFAAAQAGQVDIVSVPPTFADQDVPGMDLLELESVDNRGIMFPYVKEEESEEGVVIGNDVTADAAIRKAINLAVNRQALVDDVLEGYGTPAYSVADQLPWWNSDTTIEDADMERAKAILEEAGWQLNAEGVREKDGLAAGFTLLYPADDEVRQTLSMAFAEMMKPLGIDIQTEGENWSELEDLAHSHPVMMGWGSHDPLEMYFLYSSKYKGEGWYNSNYYSNEQVDQYMSQALEATSMDEANEYWQDAQWDGETGFSVKGDAPWAWLVNLDHLYFVREGLDIGEQKVQPHGHGWPVTDYITQWRWVGK
ncbi:ABC transporter substrate-binding protein [Salipaludibacillus sp. CF4.18]|uniref:ABC transporter substrate-binding protein n=1 Tax=Salipaludibacillus sp. CF4.18 TaxID=3373081 RepID=UPI003EE721E4